MYKQDLALNNLKGLTCCKAPPTNLCVYIYIYIYIYIYTPLLSFEHSGERINGCHLHNTKALLTN